MLEYLADKSRRMTELEARQRLEVFEHDESVHQNTEFVANSPRRTKVVCALAKGPLTRKYICRTTGISSGHMGEVLKSMEKWYLVECRTPQLRRHLTYDLTQSGKTVLRILAALAILWENETSLTPLEQPLLDKLKEVLDDSIEASNSNEWP